MHIHDATEENASLMTLASRSLRTVALAFGNGRSFSATLPTQNWHSIVSIVLRYASADLRRLMTKSLRKKPGAVSHLPVCAETLSLLRLLHIVERLNLEMAERIAEGWIQMPLRDRVAGRFRYQDLRVVHAQLLGLNEQPSSMITSQIPQQFHGFIRATSYNRYSGLDLCWRTADTHLGSSCLALVGPLVEQLEACLAISSCTVSYPHMHGGGLPEAHRAMQALINQIPSVIANHDLLRFAGWHPVGHDIIEIVDYLEDLKSRIGDARP